MCSLLEKKLALFNRYVSITKRMKDAFIDNGLQDPRPLISKRQACIASIGRVDVLVDKILERSSDWPHLISAKCRASIAGYLKHLTSVMVTVDQMDREVMGMFKEQSEDIKSELVELHKVGQAAKGYGDKMKAPPRFLDTTR